MINDHSGWIIKSVRQSNILRSVLERFKFGSCVEKVKDATAVQNTVLVLVSYRDQLLVCRLSFQLYLNHSNIHIVDPKCGDLFGVIDVNFNGQTTLFVEKMRLAISDQQMIERTDINVVFLVKR